MVKFFSFLCALFTKTSIYSALFVTFLNSGSVYGSETTALDAASNPINMSWFSLIFVTTIFLVLIIFLSFTTVRLQRYQRQLKDSEERLRLSLMGSRDEMWDWNITQGKICRLSPGESNTLLNEANNDFPPNKEHIHPADLPRVTNLLQGHVDGQFDHFEATYRIKNAEGNWVWVLDKGKIVHNDNTSVRMAGTTKDINLIKHTEDRLSLFARCLDNISDAIVILDEKLRVVDVNRSFTRLTGYERENIIQTPLRLSLNPDMLIDTIAERVRKHGSWSGELDAIKQSGGTFQAAFTLDYVNGNDEDVNYFVGVFSDITEKKKTEDRLKKLSYADALTGLPNRAYFYHHMQQLVENNVRHALLVFDLDNFKKINDSLGHQIGDVMLCRVAERIQTLKNSQRNVYRLGGDEFALTIENTNDIHTITSTAKEILSLIYKPFSLSNHEVVISSSIGIVLFPEDGIDPESLLRNADTSMYHAKEEGNRYLFFNDTMNKQAVKRLQIENLIRHGLKEDYFSVYYQPKMSMKTGRLVGMEALVRFITPKRGIISPGAFIPVAEETGQIVEIGEVVLQKACEDVKAWLDEGLFGHRVAVNLAAKQFSLPDLCERIDSILESTGLHPEHLELEITEGTVMDSPKNAIKLMKKLREKGIHLAIDDFGTGYSSLAYLKQFPLNTLKIDKAFIDDMNTREGANMVDTIATIAHNLNLMVVAEGVETKEQVDQLMHLECEVLQGYYYSKPLSSQEFKAFLIAQKHVNSASEASVESSSYEGSPQISQAI